MESGKRGGRRFACDESGYSVKAVVGVFSGALSDSSES
jgi:hypothetical protein